jgi:unsaturated rhamnogalacturonyl hydrolase
MIRTILVGGSLLAFASGVSGQRVSGPGPGSNAPATRVARSLTLTRTLTLTLTDSLYSVRMARSVMQRSPVVHPKWDYTAGVVLDAIERLGERTGDSTMLGYVKRNMDRLVGPDGAIAGYDPEELSLDQVAQARVLLPLYRRTGEARYRKAAAFVRAQLERQPRTAEGGFWHKKVYPQQMWLDGIYMAEPFLAGYGRAFPPQERRDFDEVARQVLLAARHLRDPRTGLYWHGWDAARTQTWANPKTGVSPNFWGRAVGWYAMALVDVLDDLPRDHPDRAQILRLLRELAPALVRVQDPVTGLWWQVLDQPNREGNYLEASASSMFVYALAKGANRGWLAPGYRRVAARGWDGLVARLLKTNPDGTLSLTGICSVAGLGGKPQRNGSFEYYISEPVVADDYKGVGPFIMASLELNR